MRALIWGIALAWSAWGSMSVPVALGDEGAPSSPRLQPRKVLVAPAAAVAQPAQPAQPATPAQPAPSTRQKLAPTLQKKQAPAATPATPVIAPVRVTGNEPADVDEQATHSQSKIIEVSRGDGDKLRVNAFCLDAQGRILAACGEGPGEVRILDAEGVFQSAWPVEVKPESIGMSPDGTVLVAGNGKIFRFSATGEVLQQVESPHAVALRDHRGKLREQAVQNLSRSVNSVESRITAYRQIIESLKKKQEAKEELNDQERRLLELLPQQLTQLEKQLAEQGEVQKPRVSEEAVEQQVTSLANYKRRMASIAADKDFVYVATPALVGYGFEVWRMKHDFTEAKVVVTGLSGCCGQMDVQVSASGLYVAENARHRVARYQPDGSLLATWGKADRSGLEGFTSCCNPMNVCFNRQGDVYTAESNTGRIKRFKANGEFVEFVGDIKLVPGCKNVSIAVSADGSRIYMLDITRNHIVLMLRKSAAPESEKAAAESAPAKVPAESATPRAASRPARGV